MDVKVTSHLGDLEADLDRIAVQSAVDMYELVREGVTVGNDLAKDFARRSSGTHARLYPGTFSKRMNKGFSGFGSDVYQGEYGPLGRGQGLLAPILENGSRNNPPHLNLARSADIIGPALQGEVRRKIDGWFW